MDDVQQLAVDGDARRAEIADVLASAFEPLIQADSRAFRRKFRKMAADPFAFYRGSAPLYYADVTRLPDEWADERTSRVWIQGDLHAENYGTYMDASGILVFDVNDFDEAYGGHFTWDLRHIDLGAGQREPLLAPLLRGALGDRLDGGGVRLVRVHHASGASIRWRKPFGWHERP